MTWVVRVWVILLLLVVLWYIPAARHVGCYKMPLAFPVLCFAVDDFSMLGLHPKPRSAVNMYRIMVLRVVVLLILYLLGGKKLPTWLDWCLFDQDIRNKFVGKDSSGEESDF